MTDKVSDVMTPKGIVVELKGGKKAVLGPVTLHTMCWAEERYGSWEEFVGKVLSNPEGQNIRGLSEFLYQLLENPEDFASLDGFRKAFAMDDLLNLVNAMNSQIAASMPKAGATKKKGGAAGK